MAVSPISAARMLDKPVPVRLRQYQDNLLGSVSRSLGRHEAAILQLPTGGGKTHIAAEFAKEASEAGQSVWFICHRREIIAQTGKALDETGVDHGFLAPGHKLAIDAKVQVGSVDYLRGKVGLLPDPAFIIWDECHHVPAPSWARLKEQYPNARHLGLTATPLRLDGLGLGEFFDDLIVGPDTRQLVEWGFLSGYRLFAPTIPDLRGVETKMGDYAKKQLNERMSGGTLIGDVIDHYKRKANGAKAVVFAVSVSASRTVVERFNAAGIPARHVDAKTPTAERDETIAALARGEIKVVSNVEIFTEGFDLPAIGAIILLRPTRSVALYRQMVGRGLRVDGGKRTVILDHAGLFYEHGMPDDFIQWSLEGKARTPSDKLRAKPLRRCPECDAVHEWALSCEACGHVYAANERTIDEAFGELIEVRRRAGYVYGYEFAQIAGIANKSVRKLMAKGLPHDTRGMIPVREGMDWFNANGGLKPSTTHPPKGSKPGEYESQVAFAKRVDQTHEWVVARRKQGLPVADNGWVHVEQGLAWVDQWNPRSTLDARDAAIKQLAGMGFSAPAIEREMARYAVNGWQSDQMLDTCPQHYVGRPQGCLWFAFKARPHPLSREHITSIIGQRVDPVAARKSAGLANHVEFGAIIGVTPHAVRKKIKCGMPATEDGLVHIETAKAWIAERQSTYAARKRAIGLRISQPMRKLTSEDEKSIKALASQCSQVQLAERFGVAPVTIWKILHDKKR